jgi:CheY-like chemotaxis protein
MRGARGGEESGRKSCQVLVLDDDPALVDLAAVVLEQRPSLEVYTETDPRQCVERITRESVDYLVSDYRMPVMDGLTVCRRVREAAGIPCIIFSSVDSPELTDRVRSEGFGFIHKGGGVDSFERLGDRITSLGRSRSDQGQ